MASSDDAPHYGIFYRYCKYINIYEKEFDEMVSKHPEIINHIYDNGDSPLEMACIDDNRRLLTKLLELGVEIYNHPFIKHIILRTIELKRVNIFYSFMNDFKLDLKSVFHGEAILCEILKNHNNSWASMIFIDSGVDIFIRDKSGNSALYHAFGIRDLNAIEKLIELGADMYETIKCCDCEKLTTFLHKACILHDYQLMYIFIDKGFDVNTIDYNGDTSLTSVMLSDLHILNKIDIMNFLLQLGADPSIPNNSGLSILSFIMNENESYSPEIAKKLLFNTWNIEISPSTKRQRTE